MFPLEFYQHLTPDLRSPCCCGPNCTTLKYKTWWYQVAQHISWSQVHPVRIKMLRRKWRERKSMDSQWCIQKDHGEWGGLKTAYIATKTKIPNMEQDYHGQLITNVQRNTPIFFLRFYFILFNFKIHAVSSPGTNEQRELLFSLPLWYKQPYHTKQQGEPELTEGTWLQLMCCAPSQSRCPKFQSNWGLGGIPEYTGEDGED